MACFSTACLMLKTAATAAAAAAAVAAGHSVVAVATSQRLLRLYSHAGRQLAVLALQGQPVSLATAGDHSAAGS
jgi:hypothetical protein